MAIDDLHRGFESAFGIPLGVVPMPGDLIQIFPGQLLWGSAISQQQPLLTQSDIEAFLEGSRAGYFLIGFWGHGVNSHAFYYVHDDGRNHVFLRLSYGGAYTDNEEQARRVATFLPAFIDFERRHREAGSVLRVVDAMGWGDYEVITADGRRRRFRRSLFLRADFYLERNFDAYLEDAELLSDDEDEED
jgi:hypothetical protein